MSPVARAALASWSVPPWATVFLLLAGFVYLRGWRRLSKLRPTRFGSWRLVCFISGLATVWIAISSPLDAFAGLLLSAHMVQHLLLMAVAPPLLLLGAPELPLLKGLPRTLVRNVLGPFLAWPAIKRLGRALTHPVVGLSAMTLVMWGWHVPAAYELALRSPSWHQVEHACFLVASFLFWWPVVLPWPSRPHWPAWSVPLYLLAGDVANTALAAVLTFSDRVLYPSYDAAPRLFGLSALADQALAGVIMWVPGSLAFLGPAAFVTARLLAPERLRRPLPVAPPPPRIAAGRSGFDLLRMPVLGPFLRSRYGRRALQAALVVVAALVIADGFLGPPVGGMNLAGLLPWTQARGLLVIALLAAGNLFCMACPFTLPRELGKRLGLATRAWPAWLRSKWLAALLLAIFFWAYERFDLWDRPSATAWILVGYFVASFGVDAFFRGASFCKYVCPIGQFQFVGSLVSPLEVKVRRPEACAQCTTHDCLRGNAFHRGCELDLSLPQKAGNLDCTFCLDCVKACPYENIGILPVPMGRELVRDAARSSVGRFETRWDLAALALVFVVAAFSGAFTMVRPEASAGFVAAVVAAVLAGAALSPRRTRVRLLLTLVPLGLAMSAAHFLFHTLTGWGAVWPTLQRALHLGAPTWAGGGFSLSARTLLQLQVGLLDGGLLLTLYAAWRVAKSRRAMLPGAAVAFALWAAGVWIFLQPMPMRLMAH
jgi:cytochrome c oxidase assembly factor CtaG/polyferredoxin